MNLGLLGMATPENIFVILTNLLVYIINISDIGSRRAQGVRFLKPNQPEPHVGWIRYLVVQTEEWAKGPPFPFLSDLSTYTLAKIAPRITFSPLLILRSSALPVSFHFSQSYPLHPPSRAATPAQCVPQGSESQSLPYFLQ